MNKEDVETIMDYCHSNNTIKFKNTSLRLCITDGGWVNCLELRTFLDAQVVRDEK